MRFSGCRSAEIHTLQNRDRSRLLRLESLDEAAQHALAAGDFGSFEQLAPWQHNVRWLFAPGRQFDAEDAIRGHFAAAGRTE